MLMNAQLQSLKKQISSKKQERARKSHGKDDKKKRSKPTDDQSGSGTKKRRKDLGRKPNWLYKHEKPENLFETRKWLENTYRWCCPETGGRCKGNWRTHSAEDCDPDHYKKNKGASGKKSKNGKPKVQLKSYPAVMESSEGSSNEYEGGYYSD